MLSTVRRYDYETSLIVTMDRQRSLFLCKIAKFVRRAITNSIIFLHIVVCYYREGE